MNKCDEKFGLISDIVADQPQTWRDRIFLTFDIDWAHDEVLGHCIRLVEEANVRATWFVTHPTDWIQYLAENPNFELGLHPNFNELLKGKMKPGENSESIIAAIKCLVPNATAIRSHSLVQSERLVDEFALAGFSHISNTFIPLNENSVLAPWQIWDGVTVLPHCWQDNVSMRIEGALTRPKLKHDGGLRIYDFHPIHVFLNTNTIDRYEAARQYFQSPQELRAMRNSEAMGAEDVLCEIMELNCAFV